MLEHYITTDTTEWITEVFSKMTPFEFAYELLALRSALNLYLKGNGDLVDSFVREYLDSVYDIAKDVLVGRYLAFNLHTENT